MKQVFILFVLSIFAYLDVHFDWHPPGEADAPFAPCTSHRLAKRRHPRPPWTLARHVLAEELWANVCSDSWRLLSMQNCTTLEAALCLRSKMLLGVNGCVEDTLEDTTEQLSELNRDCFWLVFIKMWRKVDVSYTRLGAKKSIPLFFYWFKFIQMCLTVGFMLATRYNNYRWLFFFLSLLCYLSNIHFHSFFFFFLE